ncbi:MAG TPA: sigma 54-interacting transcriptional regulator, partial [Planctomycetia bacterium]|nr:sigma 54-interacting transcriptional regulator [Planctomycetia bacterium]
MLLHLLIVDDEEHVLDSLVPGFVGDLGKRLAADARIRNGLSQAALPLPKHGSLDIKVSAVGYKSGKLDKYVSRSPAQVHLHLCCEKGGGFRHALRLLKEQFFAAVVSDLRFSEDALGARAGRYFIEDVQRRNPETFGILYSAYQKPEGFPADRFIRKGAAANLGGEELLAKLVEGVAAYVEHPTIRRMTRELGRRGLIYQSDAFGAALRRLSDYAQLHFGTEGPAPDGRRRPRPTLLIDGETGTGKTEFAGLLHALSERRDFPFQSANCSQLTNETFLRSTLFGHVKGAFSGAAADRPGLVAAAGKGFLLLDDLHAIDEACSVILHSFLDDGEYCHLGQDEVRRAAHAAIVCTVETPRWAEVKAEQKLPESFFNRVEQLMLRIPPLRERPEDIAAQAKAYCQLHAAQIREEMELSPAAVAWLVEFGFPGGNSRKLRDFLKGLVTANARVNDYLDVPELEDYAAEIGLVAKLRPASAATQAPQPTTKPSDAANSSPAPPAPDSPAAQAIEWPIEDLDPQNWQARIARLAMQALADESGLSGDQSETECRRMFAEK